MTAVGALRIDGRRAPSVESAAALSAVCDRAEDLAGSVAVDLDVSGAPGPDWATGLDVSTLTRWEKQVRRLERLPAVTVVVASGDCGGAALDVLLAADVRIVAPDLRLVLPTGEQSAWPGMALHRLTRQAGPARARQAVLFGHPVDAVEAMALGLVDEVATDAAAAVAATHVLLEGISGREFAIRRQLILDATTTTFNEAFGHHLAACDRALRRAGAREAS